MGEWDNKILKNKDLPFSVYNNHKLRVVATILHAAFQECNIPFQVTSSDGCMLLAHSLLQLWFTLHGETILSHHATFESIRLNNSGPIEYFAMARLAFLALQPIRMAVFGGRHKMMGLVTYLTGFTFDGNDPINKYRYLDGHHRMERQELLKNQDAAIYKILAVRGENRARVNLFVDSEFELGVKECYLESGAIEGNDMSKANADVVDVLKPVFNAVLGPSALPMELWQGGFVTTFTLMNGLVSKPEYRLVEDPTSVVKIEDYKEMMTKLEESVFATFLAFQISNKDKVEGKSAKDIKSCPPIRRYGHLIHPRYNDLLTPKAVAKMDELNYTMETAAIQHNIFLARKLFLQHPIVKPYLANKFSNIKRGAFMHGTYAYATGEVSRLSKGFGDIWKHIDKANRKNDKTPHYLSKLGEMLFFFLGVAATHKRAHQHTPTALFNPLANPTFQPSDKFLDVILKYSQMYTKANIFLGAKDLRRDAVSTLTKIVSTQQTHVYGVCDHVCVCV